MSEKYWTERGYLRVNNSSTGPESTDKKLPGKYYKKKNGSNPMRRLCEQATKSIDYFVSGCLILTPIQYEERHEKNRI